MGSQKGQKYKKHTSPATAGEQNIDDEFIAKNKATEESKSILSGILQLERESKRLRGADYKGQWTEELFMEYIDKMFEYADELGIEPSIPMLRLWLDISRETYVEWKMGNSYKSYGIKRAEEKMEMLYHSKLDKNAIPQMFKLKTKYGYVEANQTEVIIKNDVTAENVDTLVQQLGLNK